MELTDLVRRAVFRFRNKMVWTSDEENFGRREEWRDLYTDFQNPDLDVVRCDCEDFALSLERYCHINLGVSPRLLSLHCVSTVGHPTKFNHAIGCIDISGTSYFWDNATRYPFYSYQDRPPHYTLIQFARYDAPKEWFETVG